ncbi:MAG: metalloregulator ArsR/SmtB family transcription factor [Opitutales bacterium]|nr:metalloregulator ArsR/SmtB family transcription factor [Opitutales bacterium]
MNAWETLKLLSDPTRVRIVNLLRQEELSVAELQDILEMGQSRISSHLALLRSGGLAIDRKDGKRTYYSMPDDIPVKVRHLVDAAIKSVDDNAELLRDRELLRRAIEQRRQVTEKYFDEIAGRLGRNYCPGRTWDAIGHFLLYLTPHIDIADLGAGEGMISLLLARQAHYVFCIDRSSKMVEVGTRLAKENGIDNLEYKLGDIEKVPLPDECVDLSLMSQSLHHAAHPQRAIAEAARILRPGGLLVILDLNEHSFEKAREMYADQWLGFSENNLFSWLRGCGLVKIETRIVTRESEEPHFETVLAVGRKPL